MVAPQWWQTQVAAAFAMDAAWFGRDQTHARPLEPS
jgi:hypothetical protein